MGHFFWDNLYYSKFCWLFVTPPAPLIDKKVRCAFFFCKDNWQIDQGTEDLSSHFYCHYYYRVPQKKCPIAIFSLNLFQRSDYTFSHVFRNQNFEPVPSKHFKHTHSEY